MNSKWIISFALATGSICISWAQKFFFAFFASVIMLSAGYSQGIELYAGYPMQLAPRSSAGTVQNFGNWNAGLNFMIYIRSVAIQFGGGYMQSNYKIAYNHTSVGNDPIRANVFNSYVNLPLMVYPKIFADGKNALSVGAGASFMLPTQNAKAEIEYEDGTTKTGSRGIFKKMVKPRISIRYSLFFGKSFLFFADLYTDITVMEMFQDSSPGHGPNPDLGIPSYYSPAMLGLNAGICYVLPLNRQMQPKYFQKKLKK